MSIERASDGRFVKMRSAKHTRTAQSYDGGVSWSIFEGGKFARLSLTAGEFMVMQRFTRPVAKRWVETGAIDTRPP